jgi:glycosyltransferase involved in cell wall biosynthesis
MNIMKKCSVIIPVYNEEKTIDQLLNQVVKVDFAHAWYALQIVVVNDGSKDQSKQCISRFINEHPNLDIVYIEHSNWGKWYSIKRGIEKADGDVFVIQDADLEYDPHDLPVLLRYLDHKKCDVIYGSRVLWFQKYGIHYSTFAFLIWGLGISFITSLFCWRLVTDEPTCYKMFRSHLKKTLLFPKENGFEWEPAITMLLLRDRKIRYGEIPIHYAPRKHSQWKKIKFKDGIKALKTLWKYRFFTYKAQ